MKLQRHPVSIDIINFAPDNNNKRERHGCLLPNTIRSLFIGPSNCGKTSLLISLILSPVGLRFENLYIFSKSLYQPKYQYLDKIFKGLKHIGFHLFNNNCEIDPLDELEDNSIFIFDDVALVQQDPAREIFSMGRHKNLDAFYLSQSYAHIGKHLIRDNCNHLAIFRQDDTNLKHIYNDHVNSDMSFDQFKKMCNLCWSDKFGFLVIDKDLEMNRGKYRKGLSDFFIL